MHSYYIGNFDMAKNFLIGGLSGMLATSCVRSSISQILDSTHGYDQGQNSSQK